VLILRKSSSVLFMAQVFIKTTQVLLTYNLHNFRGI